LTAQDCEPGPLRREEPANDQQIKWCAEMFGYLISDRDAAENDADYNQPIAFPICFEPGCKFAAGSAQIGKGFVSLNNSTVF